MSHLRIWRSNGVVYFAGQMPVEQVDVGVRDGQFRGERAAQQMAELAGAIDRPPAPAPVRDDVDR